MDDQDRLFTEMRARLEEVRSRKNDELYLVILPDRFIPYVAVEAADLHDVPPGMVMHRIPEDDYVVFRIEEKYLGDFWSSICSNENQLYYRIDLAKPRYERFTQELQPNGITEWYIPTVSHMK
ncbi:GyrI-like domain-containing protein [Paenibacillus antri]|uniref:GyrI-like domain-containing protein n=1 Tax=Paenibacillus antri TaxID=2582848 RepID=A0A5R9GBL5_9BACL|nr:GyrI-like domain-containing protein [Paenibacillus antri]TLS52479.1 GyrI-like domain-containing protein [Paenibacillus antri]